MKIIIAETIAKRTSKTLVRMVKRKRRFKRTTHVDGTCGRHTRTDA